MMDARWDPQRYARFDAERQRPFHELLARVPGPHHHIVDLGCGDGRLTRTLLERWPDARVLGVDQSAEMLEKAQPRPPRLRFEQADLAAWTSDVPPDLIVSNAALHWVPDHPELLARLVDHLAPDGRLAVQVPLNHDAPSHRAVRAVAVRSRYAPHLHGIGTVHLLPPAHYLHLLRALGCEVDLWTTTYHHVLPAPDGVLRWLEGTTLRPYLHRLDDDATSAFLAELAAELRAAYPTADGHVHYPFTRLFFVAHKTP